MTKKGFKTGMIFALIANVWVFGGFYLPLYLVALFVGEENVVDFIKDKAVLLFLLIFIIELVPMVISYYHTGAAGKFMKKMCAITKKSMSIGGTTTGCLSLLMGIPLIGRLMAIILGYTIFPLVIMSTAVLILILLPVVVVLIFGRDNKIDQQ